MKSQRPPQRRRGEQRLTERFTDWSAEVVKPTTPRTCETCGGTILAPTIGGLPRGTCHCPHNF